MNGTPSGSGPEAVAIIGMSCVFPQAPNVNQFWDNILGKVDAITDPPEDAWDESLYYDPASTETDRVYCKKGGFLGHLARFDALANNVPPNAVGGEPDQWLALQLAREALQDAGYAELAEPVRRRTAVVLGRGSTFSGGTAISVQHSLVVTQTLQVIRQLHPELSESDLQALREGLKSSLPAMDPQMVSGLVPNVVAGRIANRLDLMGPSYTMDAACASSLLAVDSALGHLIDGDCDLALAGGCHIWTPMPMLSVFCRLNALSHREQIRPFDKEADGTILGEGLGMLVLKRLEDAERDADRIYAVIRGVGVASDGKGVGVMAPRLEGEELAILRAYERAGIDPTTVGLIEAHGTGTPLGDLTEIQALNRVLGIRRAKLPTTALGSVKSMISHTVPAAGVAGIIKTALALYHRVLPPTINCEEPNPQFELETSRLYINTETRPWIHGGAHPRRAGVSAFGFGGVDAHLVLEERPVLEAVASAPPRDHRRPWDSEVCILSAASVSELRQSADELREFSAAASENGTVRLQDLALTLATAFERLDRSGGRPTLAVVAADLADLAEKLRLAAERLAVSQIAQIKDRAGIYYFREGLGVDGKLAFLFPGEGSQYPNMLSDLCLHFPEVTDCFDATDRAYRLGGRMELPSQFVFPVPTLSPDERAWVDSQLWDMEVAPAAVLSSDEALLRLLEGLEVRPDVMVGHSSGEWAALRGAGVFGTSLDERNRWIAPELLDVYSRAIENDSVPQSVLLALGADRAQVQALVDRVGEGVRIAMVNCPHQVVVSIHPEVLDAFVGMVQTEGVIMERLPFDRPFHTPGFSAYAQQLLETLRPMSLRRAHTPIFSCSTAGPFPDDSEAVKQLTADQWVREVRFAETVERLYSEGVRVFVEVGPRGNLTSFTEDILRKRPHCAVAADQERRSGTLQLNHLVGMLAAQGVPVNPMYLHRWRDSRPLDLSKPPRPATDDSSELRTQFPQMRIPDSLVERLRTAAVPAAHGRIQPEGGRTDQPAPEYSHAQLELASPSNGPQAPLERESIHAFLDTMEQFLQVQERVMSAYLRSGGSGDQAEQAAAPSLNGLNGLNGRSGAGAGTVWEAPADEGTVRQAPAEEPRPRAGDTQPTQEPAASGLPEPIDMDRFVLQVVSDRTGYPIEAISLEADLEADLGIDSIKRIEIMGSLRDAGSDSIDIERLTSLRTLREVLSVLEGAG